MLVEVAQGGGDLLPVGFFLGVDIGLHGGRDVVFEPAAVLVSIVVEARPGGAAPDAGPAAAPDIVQRGKMDGARWPA